MKIVKCGNKYINMDKVTFIELYAAIGVYAVHFTVSNIQEGEDPDIVIHLEEKDEFEAMERWLESNAEHA